MDEIKDQVAVKVWVKDQVVFKVVDRVEVKAWVVVAGDVAVLLTTLGRGADAGTDRA